MKETGSAPLQRPKPEGRYADRFKIGYHSSVFVLGFDQSFYENEEKRIHTRIITTPEYAKAFLELLQESIGQYEKEYGLIPREPMSTGSALDI